MRGRKHAAERSAARLRRWQFKRRTTDPPGGPPLQRGTDLAARPHELFRQRGRRMPADNPFPFGRSARVLATVRNHSRGLKFLLLPPFGRHASPADTAAADFMVNRSQCARSGTRQGRDLSTTVGHGASFPPFPVEKVAAPRAFATCEPALREYRLGSADIRFERSRRGRSAD
jgi:hypothetical protein